MGPNESALREIASQGLWAAPALAPLERALSPLKQALNDLSQLDPDTWSGAAATKAKARFATLSVRYGEFEKAIREIRLSVEEANRARNRAIAALDNLPPTKAPAWVLGAVNVAVDTGKPVVELLGVERPVGDAVSGFERWMGEDREAEAHEVLVALRYELQHEYGKLFAHRRTLGEGGFGKAHRDPEPKRLDEIEEWHIPEPPPRIERQPKVPVPDLRMGIAPAPGLDSPPRTYIPGPERPGGPIESPISRPLPVTPGLPYPQNPPSSSPSLPGGDGSTAPIWSSDRGPDVDSGSAGTIGGSGLAAGALGGGALAGGAALRWGSTAGTRGAQSFGAGGAPGAGGVGGLLGPGGAGGAGVGGSGGLAGGRGLAAGLPGGGSGTGATSGAGAGSGAGARGGMVGGGGMGGGGGGSDNKDKKSGLGGHIAPKLEDDDDFIPQSDSARAGSRDKKA